MERQKQKQTKWGWGAVALVGLFVAFATIETNVIVALSGAAMLAFGAYKGGYMTENPRRETARRETNQLERRAA